MRPAILCLLCIIFLCNCNQQIQEAAKTKAPFVWENANIYFLLTDRFYNGDSSNDLNFERSDSTAVLRGMMGGDIKGITQKIKEGYFTDLGVNAIWFTPVVEQNHGLVDEGTGATYPYHGYWAQDWTALDPNFGTEDDLAELVETAHQNDIRILIDVVINHTGPVTDKDPVWPIEWVRTEPHCEYTNYENTVSCTLVKNLPDVKTESDETVELPASLKAKWESEGRLEQEIAELDDFFQKTGRPRAPRFYIMKWLIDFIKKYGVDGFRVDTAKHTEETVWKELKEEADKAFAAWKMANPEKVLDDNDFYMVGEVYNYNIGTGPLFDMGDQKVNFFENGLTSLINFGFKEHGNYVYDSIFTNYSKSLNGPLKGKSVVNYISSHDDSSPFDKERQKPFESATKLLLCPGATQIYYGDETARPLIHEGANGDANLRTFMNWDELENNAAKGEYTVQEVLQHWQKLGKFRNSHPSVGAGTHQVISENPYYFTRTYQKGEFNDKIVVGLDLPSGQKKVPVSDLFEDGERLTDHYSGIEVEVDGGEILIDTPFSLVLLGK
ncbi:MAG: alpha-amylase family glycosyl hydrolase [Bacteroidota bacterium]